MSKPSKYILHVFPHEQFADNYMEKINQYFNWNDHYFIFLSSIRPLPSNLKSKNHIIYLNAISKYKRYFSFLSLIKHSDKVIFHSLPSNEIYLACISMISKFKKIIWMIWGYDLYNEYWDSHAERVTRKQKLKEKLRESVIKHVNTIMYIEGDYETATKWYRTKADYMYASYTYELDEPVQLKVKSEKDKIKILVGHSATNNCRHVETFKILKEQKITSAEVYCPMAYPKDDHYINLVQKAGDEILGNVNIFKDYMPYDKYMEFLCSIDIAIFNNDRQQGLGNIAGLLALGKKVYINKENNLYDFFKSRGVKVFEFNTDKSFDTTPLTETERDNNSKIVRELFSDKEFIMNWSKVFKK